VAQDIDAQSAAEEEGRRLPSTVLKLAGPVLIERLSVSVLSAVDAFLVGHYVGAEGVAAVGISALLFWVPLAGAFGLDIATTAVIARDYGSGETNSLERTLRASLIAAFLWGAIGTLVLWVLAGPLLTLMDAEPDVRSFGIEYIRAASLSFPLLLLMYAASGAMRGLGNTWIPMLMSIVLNIVNAIVAFLLISGVIGIELEVLASGIGTAVGGAVGGTLAIVVLVRGIGPVRYRLKSALVTGWAEVKRLSNIGVPAGLEEVQFMLAFLVYTRMVSGLGTAAIAAHTIALRTLELAIAPGFSFGAAATTLVSRYLGAQRPAIAERAAIITQMWAMGTMIVLGGALAIFAPQFVRFFVDDQEVVDIGAKLLRIFAIAFPFMGLHASLGGALRGAGDVRYVLGVITVTAWLVRVPIAIILTVFLGMGAPGAWIGATTENIVRGGLIWGRFRAGHWKEKVV
jgi:putative MATE family efflux protein